jgi:hypothetical protein
VRKWELLARMALKEGYYARDDGVIVTPRGVELSRKSTVTYLNFSYWYVEAGQKKKGTIPQHKFAAYYFFGEAVFEKGIEVRHLNGNEKDNSRENLKLGTHKENIQDTPKEIRLRASRENGKKGAIARRIFNEEQIKEILNMRSKGLLYKEIAEIFSCSKTTITNICLGNHYREYQKPGGNNHAAAEK